MLLPIVLIFMIAFVCSYVDSAFGMGYGTLMSPVLLIFGYEVAIIVPVLLLSQMCTGISACIFHQKFKNVNFKNKQEKHTKQALTFTALGGIAMTFAVLLVISIPGVFLMIYTGIMIALVGILLLFKRSFNTSGKNMYLVGGIGAFNKALSGGGFGPLLTSGQIIGGSEARKAVAITSFSEVFLSALGFILFIIFSGIIDFSLALVVIISGILAAPIGAFHAKKMKDRNAKGIIGIIALCLGTITLIKCFF